MTQTKDEIMKTASEKMKIKCNECGHLFQKNITAKTYEIKCPKCKSYDTGPA
jgi:Zn finger protein HypA/HybF involved in hydrogenase expression